MKEIKGKFIIAFDTIVDGWQCAKDENENPDPTLFDSEADAMRELFDDALSMLNSQTDEEREENGISEGVYAEMKRVSNEGDPKKMNDFLEANPECKYNGEFIVPADEFILGRKTIFNGQGIVIEGTKLEDL